MWKLAAIPTFLMLYIHTIWYRYALYSRNANLVDILRRIVYAYNHRVHSALNGMTPAEVINDELKEFKLRLHRYPWLAHLGGIPVRAQIDPRAPPIGSFVRVLMQRKGVHAFAKETDTHATRFSHALYQIFRYDLMFMMMGRIYCCNSLESKKIFYLYPSPFCILHRCVSY